MRRTQFFTFRVNDDDRQMIKAVAENLQRTQSDTIRWSISELAFNLGIFINPLNKSQGISKPEENNND